MLGERDANLEQLRAIAEKNRIKVVKGFMYRYLGAILMNLGGSHLTEAERWTERAIEADSTNGTRFCLGLDHALYGEFFKRQGEINKARKEFKKTAEILDECGADGWVKKYEEEVAAIG